MQTRKLTPPSQYFQQTQHLKDTSVTNLTQFSSNNDEFESGFTSRQNSHINLCHFNQNTCNSLESLNVYQLLNVCDQFIGKHAVKFKKQDRQKYITAIHSDDIEKPAQLSSQCKCSSQGKLQWAKGKMQLQRSTIQLDSKIHNLSLSSNIVSFFRKQVQGIQTTTQSNVSSATSIFKSQISQIQHIQQNQFLLLSIKDVNQRLFLSEKQNKYLQIQNYTLMRNKNSIQMMKKQVEKTKHERDMFKKKLIVMTKKMEKNNQVFGPNAGWRNNITERNQTLGLKHRERLLTNINENESLFQLSLTDDHSSSIQSNDQSTYHQKKKQRICFAQQRQR